MAAKKVIALEFPVSPAPSDSAAASAAIALAVALLRALRDRGVLSAGEIDDVLSEAGSRFTHGPQATAFRYVIEQARADLDRTDTE